MQWDHPPRWQQSPKNEAPDTCWLIDLEDSGRRIQQKNQFVKDSQVFSI